MAEAIFTTAAWAKWLTAWLAWLGIGLVPFAAAAAVIWFAPPLRKWAILAAIGWGLAFGGYTYGDINGAARIKAEWDAAERAAVDEGKGARSDAEQEVEQAEKAAPAPPAPTCACVPRAPKLPNDPDDRDND